MTRKRKTPSAPRRFTLRRLAAEVAHLRREVGLLSLQGKLDELMIRVARIESDRSDS